MSIITPSAERVPAHTTPATSERIHEHTERAVARAAQGGPQDIERRLAELDREWDVERCLETGAASISLLGAALGTTVNRKWFLLPAAVAGFLLQHALQGWCPPLPLFRRLGVRTADEINQERYALKALRGDFTHVAAGTHPAAVRQAIEATRH